MRKKILFAVMALLTMATGKIRAAEAGGTTTDGSTAYVVLCEDNSLHFLCSSETLAEGGTLSENGPKINGVWKDGEVLTTGTSAPGWQANNSSVTSVVIDNSFASARPMSCCRWFMSLKECTSISGMENLNTFYVTNMNRMFYSCSSLGNITFGANFSTSKVTNMGYMFYSCSGLTTLNGLSSFNTSIVTNMNRMFYGCSSLGNITFGANFSTSNVTNMSNMFNGCSGLTSLDLSNFDTSNVTDMSNMFNGCSGLTSLDLSNFDTSNVTNMSYMFNSCSSLTSLDGLSNFDTSKVTNMQSMFQGCSGLKSLDLSSFNTLKVTNMQSMFNGCSGLTSLTLGSFDMSNVSISYYMFDGCIPSGITINGSAFVFVTGEDQKKLWEGFNGLKLVVDGVYDGDVVIDSENYNDAPLIFSRDFTANSVTFRRSFAAGKPHTIFLPFAIKNTASYGKFYEYGSYNPETGEVTFKKVDETAANKPYLFEPNEDNGAENITVTIEGADGKISATTAAVETEGFNGVYEKRTFTQEEADEKIYYGWANGEFRRAGAGAYVNPCRAYLKLPAENGVGEPPARLSVKLGDGTTGIGTAKSDANGGAEAPMYNLQGQRVGSGYKGVVIKNGKKMIVK